MSEVQKYVDDIKEKIDENLRLTSKMPFYTTTKETLEDKAKDI